MCFINVPSKCNAHLVHVLVHVFGSGHVRRLGAHDEDGVALEALGQGGGDLLTLGVGLDVHAHVLAVHGLEEEEPILLQSLLLVGRLLQLKAWRQKHY